MFIVPLHRPSYHWNSWSEPYKSSPQRVMAASYLIFALSFIEHRLAFWRSSIRPLSSAQSGTRKAARSRTPRLPFGIPRPVSRTRQLPMAKVTIYFLP